MGTSRLDLKSRPNRAVLAMTVLTWLVLLVSVWLPFEVSWGRHEVGCPPAPFSAVEAGEPDVPRAMRRETSFERADRLSTELCADAGWSRLGWWSLAVLGAGVVAALALWVLNPRKADTPSGLPADDDAAVLGTPDGWYPDPYQHAERRYFANGEWTDHTA